MTRPTVTPTVTMVTAAEKRYSVSPFQKTIHMTAPQKSVFMLVMQRKFVQKGAKGGGATLKPIFHKKMWHGGAYKLGHMPFFFMMAIARFFFCSKVRFFFINIALIIPPVT